MAEVVPGRGSACCLRSGFPVEPPAPVCLLQRCLARCTRSCCPSWWTCLATTVRAAGPAAGQPGQRSLRSGCMRSAPVWCSSPAWRCSPSLILPSHVLASALLLPTVVQRFLERGGDDVRQAVADAIRGKALPLSLQVYGCRVVQKALEVRASRPG